MDIPENKSLQLLVIPMLLLLIISAGCSYGFRGSLPEHIQSVKIIPIRSRVTQYGLEQDITSRITEMMVRDGRLAVVLEGQDSEIEGTIAAYSKSPYSYTSSEQVEEYKLEIRVEITFIDLLRETDIISNESVTTWLVYDPDTETEIDARNRLLEEASKDIVRRCLSGW
ncbi:MAG: LptE family protein [Candidatus Aegiribacteria sp.]|nr:LptE family protein [Candidatus Aegiribacteria sp.]